MEEARTGVFEHPVCAALEIVGQGAALPLASGRADAFFANDGQITKRPIRALTLSALAPRRGEHLWDIGGGSGSISIEWLLTHSSLRATCIELNADRAARIKTNALELGVDRLNVIQGAAPEALADLSPPDAVFIGGGLSEDLLARLKKLEPGTRLVANAVTLESEELLMKAQQEIGGALMRIAVSSAEPIGSKHGWRSSMPILQWCATL